MVRGNGVFYMSRLLGSQVKSRTGEDLGELNEIVLDTRGFAKFGIVKAGGGFLSSGQFYPLPYEAFSLQSDEETLVADLPNDVFESAPHFEDDSWPDMGNEDWQTSVRSYYDRVHVG